MVKIVDKDAAVLRVKTKAVATKDIKSAKIKKIIRDMKTALDGEEDGVAIAAPQIGCRCGFSSCPEKFSTSWTEKKNRK